MFVFSPNTVAKSSYVNQNFSDLLAATSIVGEVRMYSGTVAPSGWLIADGSAVNRTTYSDLFSLIGTAFGVGNGTTTFNIPDLRDKFPIGVSETKARASTGGEAAHTLSVAELAVHRHTTHTIVRSEGTTANITMGGGNFSTDGGYAGSGNAHNNIPPYVALNYIVKF